MASLARVQYLAITSTAEDLSIVDTALKKSGSIVLDVPYLSVGAVPVQSNLVALLGWKLAGEFRRVYLIEVRELPFDTPRVRSVLTWHRRFDDVPAHKWLQETIFAAKAAIFRRSLTARLGLADRTLC